MLHDKNRLSALSHLTNASDGIAQICGGAIKIDYISTELTDFLSNGRLVAPFPMAVKIRLNISGYKGTNPHTDLRTRS